MSSLDWTCGRCGVAISFQTGAELPDQPVGWAKENGSWLCLGCRREGVIEAASEGPKAERKSHQRRALIEFEVLRDPEVADQVIAKRVRCSTAHVTPIRAAMGKAGRATA